MARLGVPAGLEDYLEAGDNLRRVLHAVDRQRPCLIVAPRRAGKTSLMRVAGEMLLRSESRSPDVVHADLSYADSPYELIRRIAPEDRDSLVIRQIRESAFDPEMFNAIANRSPLVLFLDEVDRPLLADNGHIWLRLLDELSATGRISLVLSMEPTSLRLLREAGRWPRFLNEAEEIRLTPWPIAAIHEFMIRALRDLPAKIPSERLRALAEALQPAWPHEVIRALIELEDRGPISIDAILDAAADAIGGHASLSHFVANALGRRTATAANWILEAIARDRGAVNLNDIRYSAAELYDAASRLNDLGIIHFDERKREAKAATGLIAWKLRRDALLGGR